MCCTDTRFWGIDEKECINALSFALKGMKTMSVENGIYRLVVFLPVFSLQDGKIASNLCVELNYFRFSNRFPISLG